MNTSWQALARNAGVVMAAFVLSNVVGLVRQMLVSSAFGTSPQLDAFNAALRVPDLLFSLVAGGALASAFLPLFSGLSARGDELGAWRLTSALLNLVTAATLASSAVAWLLAPWIVRVLVGRGFDPAQQVLSVDLMRILLVTPVLFGLSGLLMGVQNARGRFLIPALAPTCYWLGMIVGLLLWVPGRGIYGLAWGAVLGAFMYLGLQVAGLWGQHAPYTPALGLSDPAVRRVGRLMGPRLLGVAANQLAFLVTTVLASYVAGGVSALDYAWRVFTMPQVVIAQGLAVAALPAFSALVARGELDEVRERLADTLIGMLFLAVPATVGLVLLREPIVAMLFQRGSFGPESTAAVAAALGFFSLGLIGHSTVEIVSRAFYALQDTRTPVLVAGYTVLANVALGLGLLLAFTRAGFQPVGGLALATSLAVTLEMVALVVLLRRRLSGIGFARIGPAVARMGAAALVMAVLVAGWLALTSGTGPWIIGLGGAVVGVAVYWSAALGLGSPEARAATEALRSRRRRRPVPGPRRHTRRFAPGTSRPPRSEEQDPP